MHLGADGIDRLRELLERNLQAQVRSMLGYCDPEPASPGAGVLHPGRSGV